MKKIIKDVHTEHCCILHGCKYGNEDCTVTTKRAPQSYICESCSWDGIKELKDIRMILNKRKKRCPNCGHLI